MAEVKVLIKGYTSDKTGKSCATISLVKDKDIIMVVDPGCLKSRQMLIDALKKEGLGINDINYVCLTHSHIDHYINAGMFPKARVLEKYGLWHKDNVKGWKEQFSKDIKIIKTPGHDKTSITLLVKTNKGTIAVCGDLFWGENYPKKDPYADNPKKLIENRKKVLGLADWIVPGHADIYKVKK
jgi:glyoxylase-like metal-dependent hydrolase (beta-lactamase superfamily II)